MGSQARDNRPLGESFDRDEAELRKIGRERTSLTLKHPALTRSHKWVIALSLLLLALGLANLGRAGWLCTTTVNCLDFR